MTNIPESPFYIVSKFNNRVLDVEGGSKKDHAHVCVWQQKSGRDNENQLWKYQNGYFINVNSGKVLDVKNKRAKSGERVIQNERANSGNEEEAEKQRWNIDREGYIHVKSDPNLVLDIRGNEDEDGAEVILYPRRQGAVASNQQWNLEPAR